MEFQKTSGTIAGLAASLVLAGAGSARALTTEEVLSYRGADREQVMIDGAKKEGQVVFYCALIVTQALRPIADNFMKKYPFVKVSYWRGESEAIAQKLAAEMKANNLQADLVEGTGVGEIVVQAGQAVPFYSPRLEEFPERYRDKRGLWAATRLSYFSLGYNTKLVAADKVPKSYEDLLDPMWKGKLAWRIESASGTPLFITNLRLAWGEERARAYFRKLSEQKVINFGSGSARTLVDRVLAGEYPIAMNIFAHHPQISKQKGAPVDSKLLDPTATTAGTMVVPKGVRHPYGAMLLADYVLSKDGQAILANAEYFPARPDVPPIDSISHVVPSSIGVPDNFVSPENLNKYNESSEAIYQEMFR